MNFSDWLDGFLSHDECDHTRRGMECPALDADDCGTTCDVFVIPRSADRPDCVAAVEAERRRVLAVVDEMIRAYNTIADIAEDLPHVERLRAKVRALALLGDVIEEGDGRG